MNKSLSEKIEELVKLIQEHGCRLTIPYEEPSPLTVMFDGDFSSAEYIPYFPSTLHIYGICGHVSVSSIISVDKVQYDKYVVRFGANELIHDLMVRVSE